MWKVAEFGELIGVSPSTLQRWEAEGRLKPVQGSEVASKQIFAVLEQIKDN